MENEDIIATLEGMVAVKGQELTALQAILKMAREGYQTDTETLAALEAAQTEE